MKVYLSLTLEQQARLKDLPAEMDKAIQARSNKLMTIAIRPLYDLVGIKPLIAPLSMDEKEQIRQQVVQELMEKRSNQTEV